MANLGVPQMSKYEMGQEFPSKTFLLNRAKLIRYANASGDHHPAHVDETFAKSVGLENVIAQGMYTMGLVGQYVSQIAGSQNVKQFSVRFVRPVVVPDGLDVDLTVCAVVDGIDGETISLAITATSGGVEVLGLARAKVAR